MILSLILTTGLTAAHANACVDFLFHRARAAGTLDALAEPLTDEKNPFVVRLSRAATVRTLDPSIAYVTARLRRGHLDFILLGPTPDTNVSEVGPDLLRWDGLAGLPRTLAGLSRLNLPQPFVLLLDFSREGELQAGTPTTRRIWHHLRLMAVLRAPLAPSAVRVFALHEQTPRLRGRSDVIIDRSHARVPLAFQDLTPPP